LESFALIVFEGRRLGRKHAADRQEQAKPKGGDAHEKLEHRLLELDRIHGSLFEVRCEF
jgi:hypothetical protein